MAGLDPAIQFLHWLDATPTSSWPGLTRQSSFSAGTTLPHLVMAGFDPAIQPCRHSVPMREGHVYIMANKRNGTIYIGVTSNLSGRVHEHKEGRGSVFTRKYGLKMLVWYETYPSVTDAIQRETSLKRWPRKWKLDLIEQMNPEWEDLYLSF